MSTITKEEMSSLGAFAGTFDATFRGNDEAFAAAEVGEALKPFFARNHPFRHAEPLEALTAAFVARLPSPHLVAEVLRRHSNAGGAARFLCHVYDTRSLAEAVKRAAAHEDDLSRFDGIARNWRVVSEKIFETIRGV